MATESQARKVPSERGRALDWREWNFDGVTQAELVACCYWEYARESAFIRDTLRDGYECVRRDVEAGDKVDLAKQSRPDWCGKLDKIQSIGYPADVFVRGFCFGRGRRSDVPDAPPITGSFPDPWQSLADDEKKERARGPRFREHFRPAPVNLADWRMAREIVRRGDTWAGEQLRQWKEYEKRYLYKNAEGYLRANPGAPDLPDSPEMRPGFFIGDAETVLLEIAWNEFTNESIADYFRKVLPKLRPPTAPAPDRRGHKPRDVRADLTRLAAMRLLSRYTPVEILGNARRPELAECAPIHKTKQFASDKWGDPTKWRDARREVLERLHQLFPFLPADEKPLSWRREK